MCESHPTQKKHRREQQVSVCTDQILGLMACHLSRLSVRRSYPKPKPKAFAGHIRQACHPDSPACTWARVNLAQQPVFYTAAVQEVFLKIRTTTPQGRSQKTVDLQIKPKVVRALLAPATRNPCWRCFDSIVSCTVSDEALNLSGFRV